MNEQINIKPFQWLFDKRYRWAFHVVFWLVMYFDEILSFVGITEPFEDIRIPFLSILIDMAMVYFNLYILIPWLFLKNQTTLYFIFTAIIVMCNAILMASIYCDPQLYDCDFTTTLISSTTATVALLGTAVGFKIFKSYIQNQEKVNELKNQNLETELEVLKDQINPHFLFNALNGIHVQSRKRPEEVPESILLLSDLLRYQLYDCAQEKVMLKNEIDYLHNYLELEKTRRNDAKIDFHIDGHPNGHRVAPFLFIPFVENAIKHGSSMNNDDFINIYLKIEENKIHFLVENSKPENPIQHIGGGIGLPNVKRRLELLYPDAHELNITDEKEKYKIQLTLMDKS